MKANKKNFLNLPGSISDISSCKTPDHTLGSKTIIFALIKY